MNTLQGRTVLITGAASGLGRLLALRLAAAGADLVLWDVDEPGLERVQGELGSPSVRIARVDVSDAEAVALAASGVEVDLLINNAGVVEGRPFLEITPAGLQRTFGVNTFALYWVTRAFLPGMIARGRGHVVTVASASGFVGAVRLADYAASKHAAVGFHESLRLELRRDGHPIRTTLVCPYFIGTGMFDGVKTRFPRLLPILSPDWVADRIVEAIRKERPRLLLPRGVWVVFLARYLPVAWFDWIAERLGLSRAMDGFRGQRSRRD